MGIESILTGKAATSLAPVSDKGAGAQPLSDAEALVASAANGNSPLVRGGALRALDEATGDRTLSDRLVGGTTFADQAAPSQPVSVPGGPAPLTIVQRTQRLQAAMPDALASIRTAAADPALTPGEAADLRAAADALGRTDTKFAYGAIHDQPRAAAAAATRNGKTTITINPSAPTLFKPDGSVEASALAEVLAHEGRHAHDANFHGERDGPSTLAEERRTERNAYRTQAAYLKAVGGTANTIDPSGATVPLTASTANFAAELSVTSLVGAAAKAAIQTNRTIDANYSTYLHRLTDYDRAHGTHTTPEPRQLHALVPTYTPPANY